VSFIERPPLEPLNGDESFQGVDGTVTDFWRFALPSLSINNTRGWFAEYLVWRALGFDRPMRIEWDEYDVRWGDVSIEVKSTALVQQWDQSRLSKQKFSGLKGQRFDPLTGKYAPEATYNADVYVFAAHTATTHAAYDQLDVSQWTFVVLPRAVLAATGYESIAWSTVRSLSDGVTDFKGLPGAIETAATVDQPDPS